MICCLPAKKCCVKYYKRQRGNRILAFLVLECMKCEDIFVEVFYMFEQIKQNNTPSPTYCTYIIV